MSFSSASVFIPNFIHPFIRNLIPIFFSIFISIFLFILFFLFIFIPSSSPIFADSSSISSIQDIVVNDQVLSNIVSFESLHFTAGYKQGFDTSCGIAVAASILKFFYNINLDEKSLIEQFFTRLTAKKDYTISLLDIKQIKNSSLINKINQQLKDRINHLYLISNIGIH